MKRFISLTITTLLILSQFSLVSFATKDTSNTNITPTKSDYYILDCESNTFVKGDDLLKLDKANTSDLGTLTPITIDRVTYLVKINNVTLSDTESDTNTELYRLQSVEDGQSNTEQATSKEDYFISDIKKKNDLFNCNLDMIKRIIMERIKVQLNLLENTNVADTTGGLEDTSSSSIQGNDEDVGNNPSSSSDSYILKGYRTYDIEGEISYKYGTTDTSIGYVELRGTVARPGGDYFNSWLQCGECDYILKDLGQGPYGGEPATVDPDNKYFPYNDVYHIKLANGVVKHFTGNEWLSKVNQVYFQYYKATNTKITFKLHQPLFIEKPVDIVD